MILEAQSVSVRYPLGTALALDRASLGLDRGALVALAGPNGSGKTTLLRALLGSVPLSHGVALLEGRPVAGWPRVEIARRVAVVSQREENWFPLRVEESVLLGRYPRLGALSPVSRADESAVRAALERCDAWHLRRRPLDALSGGEWQRTRIARALAQEPIALVLDEPANSLDVRHEMEVMEILRSLVDGGIACLLITHHLNLAARYADQVVLLDGGRVVASGPPADVLREEVVSAVFRWPVAVTHWRDGTPQLVPLRPGEAMQ